MNWWWSVIRFLNTRGSLRNRTFCDAASGYLRLDQGQIGWAWFRRRTFHVPNLIEEGWLWSDTGGTSDSDGAPCVEPKLSSTKVRQTLSNLTLLPHQTKTAVLNWFRRRSSGVLNSSVRFGTWAERRLNPAGLKGRCYNKISYVP